MSEITSLAETASVLKDLRSAISGSQTSVDTLIVSMAAESYTDRGMNPKEWIARDKKVMDSLRAEEMLRQDILDRESSRAHQDTLNSKMEEKLELELIALRAAAHQIAATAAAATP